MFVPNKDGHQNRLSPPDELVVYGNQRSYFTRKLTAGLHFYRADWRFENKTAENSEELRIRSGTHQIPVLHTPEGWMIADTTPLFHMLDGRYPERPLFGRGPRGILIQMLEDYWDEWIARTTVHWRWNYPENHDLLAHELSNGNPQIGEMLKLWGGKVCRATGITSDIQKQAAEDEMRRFLTAATRQLKETQFLLGDRPTALDCVFLGAFRAHFFYDPAPRRMLCGDFPEVVEWVENTADTLEGTGELPEFPETTEFGALVLKEMAQTYKAFVLGNAKAQSTGQKAFVATIYGEDVSYLSRPYIETARTMITNRIKTELTMEESQTFSKWLEDNGLDGIYC